MTIPSATVYMISIKPHLAGTASGLGGSIMIAMGDILSIAANIVMEGHSTETPMALVMFLSSGLSLNKRPLRLSYEPGCSKLKLVKVDT